MRLGGESPRGSSGVGLGFLGGGGMMFRSALWRNEKNKVRASFKLEFHATQVGLFRIDF